MGENFELAAPARIVFGRGTLSQAGPAAAALGRKALVVTNKGAGRAEPLLRGLDEAGVASVVLTVCGEPSLDTARDAVGLLRSSRCEVVIGFGGGSALDNPGRCSGLSARRRPGLAVRGRSPAPRRPRRAGRGCRCRSPAG